MVTSAAVHGASGVDPDPDAAVAGWCSEPLTLGAWTIGAWAFGVELGLFEMRTALSAAMAATNNTMAALLARSAPCHARRSMAAVLDGRGAGKTNAGGGGGRSRSETATGFLAGSSCPASSVPPTDDMSPYSSSTD